MNLSRRELDANIVNIELTLASIIQGVALYFLTDSARTALSLNNWPSLLYLSAGLCVICIFWSRSIIHTLTLIKWPLEFGHNFLYIACALGEALLFTRLERPLAWFRLSTAYAAFVWLLFVYDLRLIRARLRETTTEAERLLYQRTWEDQLLNIRLLMPCLFLFNLACALAISHWPDYFLERAGNVWLIAAQFLSFVIYLVYVTRFYHRIAPLILRSHEAKVIQL
jgi:hypothetical protein